MSKIKVEITIPDSEYEDWADYNKNDITDLLNNLERDISFDLRRNFIKNFTIEVIEEKFENESNK
jgi:hypothetical protein